MSKLHLTAGIPGSLYVDGQVFARLPDEKAAVELSLTGAHLFYAPYNEGYLPFSRYVTSAETAAQWKDMNAVLWPGGTVEAAIRPLLVTRPRALSSAPFLGGTMSLYAADRIFLETPDGQTLPVGDGQEGGLHALQNGLIAAFAADWQGESLLVLAPDAGGRARVALHAKGREVLMSTEGDRVRVRERPVAGASFEIEREYRYHPSRGVFIQEESQAGFGLSIQSASDVPPAMIAAVMAGEMDNALEFFTPSLREMVDSIKLAAFLGPFDRCVEARHAPTVAGIQTLALLKPQDGLHIARVLAFEVIDWGGHPLIDNVRAWEGE